MLSHLEMTGGDKLERVTRELKNVDRQMRLESLKRLRSATKPLQKEVRNNLRETMPTRGGLASQLYGDTKIVTRRRKDTIRLQPKSQRSSTRERKRLEQGRLRHPVFGNREVWVTQKVPPGWFTEPVEGAAPELAQELMKTLDDIAERIATA